MAPFLARPAYVPLRRPAADGGRPPAPPRALPGVCAFQPLARAAAHIGCTLRELDERCDGEDVLDLADVAGWLHDVDDPPKWETTAKKR